MSGIVLGMEDLLNTQNLRLYDNFNNKKHIRQRRTYNVFLVLPNKWTTYPYWFLINIPPLFCWLLLTFHPKPWSWPPEFWFWFWLNDHIIYYLIVIFGTTRIWLDSLLKVRDDFSRDSRKNKGNRRSEFKRFSRYTDAVVIEWRLNYSKDILRSAKSQKFKPDNELSVLNKQLTISRKTTNEATVENELKAIHRFTQFPCSRFSLLSLKMSCMIINRNKKHWESASTKCLLFPNVVFFAAHAAQFFIWTTFFS